MKMMPFQYENSDCPVLLNVRSVKTVLKFKEIFSYVLAQNSKHVNKKCMLFSVNPEGGSLRILVASPRKIFNTDNGTAKTLERSMTLNL